MTPHKVTVRLVNKGPRPGTEVVQVYVRALEAAVRRPDRELAGFAKVSAGRRRRTDRRDRAGARRLSLLGHGDARMAL